MISAVDQFDSRPAVFRDRILANGVVGPGVHHDAMRDVKGDHIGGSSGGTADRIKARGASNSYSCGIAQRRRASEIGADVVPLNRVVGGRAVGKNDAGSLIPGNDVP